MPVFDKALKSKQQRNHRIKWGILLAASCAALAVTIVLGRELYNSPYLQPHRYVPPPAPRATRQIFPYSIVPGGVYDTSEIAASIKADPVAREHYQGIRIEDLIPMRVRKPIQAHVSYRIGDTVYWTSKTVTIAAGELVLTDGANMIRARCGNRIMRVPPPSKKRISQETDTALMTSMDVPIPPAMRSVTRSDSGLWTSDVETSGDVTPVPEPPSSLLWLSALLLISLNRFVVRQHMIALETTALPGFAPSQLHGRRHL